MCESQSLHNTICSGILTCFSCLVYIRASTVYALMFCMFWHNYHIEHYFQNTFNTVKFATILNYDLQLIISVDLAHTSVFINYFSNFNIA